MEYELYYRFTCRKFKTDRSAIPIEQKWQKHFACEDDANAELKSHMEAHRSKLIKEYEECLGPVLYVKAIGGI